MDSNAVYRDRIVPTDRMLLAERLSRPRARSTGALLLASLCGMVSCGSASAQTIEGTLLDADTRMPIPLGLVMMFTEAGDSITSTVADEAGRFRISSDEPGSFVLNAAALGYQETSAGIFELGEGGVMTVEYGLPPHPLAIDEVIVALDRPASMHPLVRNGFVRRLQRGLGAFITPYEIEQSSARSTEQLMAQIPNVRVGTVYEESGGVLTPRGDIGETVQLRRFDGSWCSPTIYVDGRRVEYDPNIGITLSMMADISSVEGIEIYRRPAEVPVEYVPSPGLICGVLVVWTKMGPAPGQGRAGPTRSAGSVEVAPDGGLPSIEETGPPPEAGERIRVELSPQVSGSLGVSSPWGGTFVMATDSTLVAADPTLGRAMAMPIDGVRGLHVLRPRSSSHAWLRGSLAGLAMGGGTWLGLSVLCNWSECHGAGPSRWLPSAATGILVGFLVHRMGPGDHWVSAPVRRSP